MAATGSVVLIRDCDAVQIPAGTQVQLVAGTEVDVTQTLGGSYTVRSNGGLYRIERKDADALGLEIAAAAARRAPGETVPHVSGLVDEQSIWDVLKTCYDPEIPVNIVDLGLVYEMSLEPLSPGRSKVNVKMTLTAPGCGMGATIAGDAREKLLSVPGIEDADVQIVWDPPWHHSRISPAGRAMLGLDEG